MSAPVDVRKWFGEVRAMLAPGSEARAKCETVYGAMADLIDADVEFDAARLSGNAIRIGEAATRRRAALARVQGGA